MQVPDIDDAMAQAVDIGENDVSTSDPLFCFLMLSCSETSPNVF